VGPTSNAKIPGLAKLNEQRVAASPGMLGKNIHSHADKLEKAPCLEFWNSIWESHTQQDGKLRAIFRAQHVQQ